jgi:SAM-dependent methyltransferase
MLAARRGSRVTGLDAAEALIEVARERLAEGDFQVGDMEDMPYRDGSFDVTFGSCVLMYADDPIVALREMHRVTVPGGRVTIGIWGSPTVCEYRHVIAAVATFLASSGPGKGPFTLSGENVLEGMLGEVGLKIVDCGEVEARFEFADSTAMWRAVRSAGPVQAAIQSVDEDQVRVAVLRAIGPFRDNAGRISMSNRFRYVTGTPE